MDDIFSAIGADLRAAVTRDPAEITADILQAEDRKLAESQAQLQVAFEEGEARFNAQLEALAQPPNDEAHLKPERWLLARRCWAWLYHDED